MKNPNFPDLIQTSIFPLISNTLNGYSSAILYSLFMDLTRKMKLNIRVIGSICV